MLLKKFSSLLCAATLTLAGVADVFAANNGFDFDQGVDAREIVIRSRKALSDSPSVEIAGKKIATQDLEDSIERRIVVFQKGTSRSRRLSAVRNTGGIPTKDLWLINAVAVIVPSFQAASVDRSLASLSDVKRVEKDFVQNWLVNVAAPAAPRALPQLPAMPFAPKEGETDEDLGQKVPWGIKRVNAKGAWDTTRGAGVKVAVIDTGIDFEHEDLQVAGGYNAIDNAVSYKDDNGHGTHVAGTIAGQDDSKGVVGVAPDATLYGVKVLSARGSGTFEGVIDGIQWAVKNKMDVANMSLGASQGTAALGEAIHAARMAGTIIVAAAGNSGGSVGYPAAYPGAIAVAASNSRDQVAYFSSRGPEVDVIAPGVSVESTYMGGGYRSLSGTSMACPHVAGLAALAVAGGTTGFDAVKAALIGAATKLEGDIPAEQQGAGLPDAAKLVN